MRTSTQHMNYPAEQPQELSAKQPNKVLTVIKNIFVVAVALIAVAMMVFTIISVNTFNQAERSLFGYKAFIVQSDSMSATDFSAGDLILVKEVAPSTLVEGDIIAFTSPNPESYGEVVTHKIRSISTDEQGNLQFQTYGTTTNTDDEEPVSEFYVLGKYQLTLPNIGHFFAFLKTVPGYICCILVPFLILIGFQVFNAIKLFRQYKQEQLNELQAERDSLAAERAEMQAMMEQLQRMQQAPQSVPASQISQQYHVPAREQRPARQQVVQQPIQQQQQRPAASQTEYEQQLLARQARRERIRARQEAERVTRTTQQPTQTFNNPRAKHGRHATNPNQSDRGRL